MSTKDAAALSIGV